MNRKFAFFDNLTLDLSEVVLISKPTNSKLEIRLRAADDIFTLNFSKEECCEEVFKKLNEALKS